MPVAVWLSNIDRNTIVGSKECGTVERQQGVSGPKCMEVTAFRPNDSVTNRGAAGAAFIGKDGVAIRMFKSVSGGR